MSPKLIAAAIMATASSLVAAGSVWADGYAKSHGTPTYNEGCHVITHGTALSDGFRGCLQQGKVQVAPIVQEGPRPVIHQQVHQVPEIRIQKVPVVKRVYEQRIEKVPVVKRVEEVKIQKVPVVKRVEVPVIQKVYVPQVVKVPVPVRQEVPQYVNLGVQVHQQYAQIHQQHVGIVQQQPHVQHQAVPVYNQQAHVQVQHVPIIGQAPQIMHQPVPVIRQHVQIQHQAVPVYRQQLHYVPTRVNLGVTCAQGCGASGYYTQPAPMPKPVYQPAPQPVYKPAAAVRTKLVDAPLPTPAGGTTYATNGYTTAGSVASDFVQGTSVGRYAQN